MGVCKPALFRVATELIPRGIASPSPGVVLRQRSGRCEYYQMDSPVGRLLSALLPAKPA